MWRELMMALILASSNVVIHAIGSYGLLKWLLREVQHSRFLTFSHSVWTLLRIFAALVVLHSLEIAIWGYFYLWQGCFSDRETAYYYSLMSYTTVGYGDVVLARPWRLMGGMEAMLGVLLFGWSTALLVTLLYYIQNAHVKRTLEGMR
jgi:hypothetical protein